MRNAPPLFILGCYAFVSLGVSAALLGPALPTLAMKADAGLEQIGLIFVSMSLGYLTSAPIINTVGARIGTRNMLIVSPLVVITSMALLATGAHLTAFFVATYLLGLGQAGTQVAYNALFGWQPEREGAQASATLNRLNAFFGIGALIGPLVAALGYALTGDATPAFWVAAAMALPLTLGALLASRTLHEYTRQQPGDASNGGAARAVLGAPVMWGMCLAMGLYVGCEVAFSGWATEFTRRMTGQSTAQAALAVSAFWTALALSRYFTNVMVSRVRPVTLVALLILLSITGLLIMMMAGPLTGGLALIGSFVVGLGFGPIYPTLIAIGIQRFPFAAQMIASILTSAGSAGALFVPALTGAAMASSPALGSVGAWLMLAGLLLIIVALWQLMRRMLIQTDASAAVQAQTM